VRYQVLGPLTATIDDRTVNLGGPKQRLVLALLLFEAGRTVIHPTDLGDSLGAGP
jgi:DNA-binding SARP family transcriptional activator